MILSIENPRWMDKDHTVLQVMVNGRETSLRISENASSLYARVKESIDHQGIAIDGYVEPDNSELKRKIALEGLDSITLQYVRRSILGQDTAKALQRLQDSQAEVDARYPEIN